MRRLSAARSAVAGLVLAISAGAQGLTPELQELARQGVEASRAKRYEEAAKAFEKLVEAAPSFAPVHLNLGLARHEQGQYAGAAAAFERALELQPGIPGVRPLLGFDLLQIGRYDDAVEMLEKAREEKPGDRQIEISLGMAYLRVDRPAQALRLFGVSDAPSEDPELMRLQAEAHARLSSATTSRLLDSFPDSIAGRLSLAERATLAGRHAEAIAIYEGVLAQEPQRRLVRVSLGDLYLETLDYHAAERVYREETKLAPAEGRAHARLGEALVLLGESEQAIAAFEQALALDPNDTLARSYLGKALFDLGRLEESEQALRHALEGDPDIDTEARARYQLAQIHRRRGDREGAARELERFQELKAQMQP